MVLDWLFVSDYKCNIIIINIVGENLYYLDDLGRCFRFMVNSDGELIYIDKKCIINKLLK